MKKGIIHSIDTAAMKRLNYKELAVNRVSMLGRASIVEFHGRGSTFAGKKPFKKEYDEFDEADCNVDDMDEGCVAVG